MNKLILIACLTIIGAFQFEQRYPDEVLDQRLCVSVQLGHTFIASALSRIVYMYVKFWNDPMKFHYQLQNSKRYLQVAHGLDIFDGVLKNVVLIGEER